MSIIKSSAVLLSVLLPLGAVAHEKESCVQGFSFGTDSPEVEKIFQILGRGGGAHRARAYIGVAFDPSGSQEGVLVQAVTPDGPAAKAGLRSGDLIVSVNKKVLKEGDADDPAGYMLELLKDLSPGGEVALAYERDGQVSDVLLIAEKDRDHGRWAFNFPHIAKEFVIKRSGHGRPFGSSPWGDIELAALNPGLGEYFGASKGVLVVQAPDSLALKAGDVILEIGGREPRDPSHTWRILNSYAADEKLKFQVMRKGKRATLELKTP